MGGELLSEGVEGEAGVEAGASAAGLVLPPERAIAAPTPATASAPMIRALLLPPSGAVKGVMRG